jgi:hypothetical protein
MSNRDDPDEERTGSNWSQRFRPFCHGTKADLTPDSLLKPGYHSNFGVGGRPTTCTRMRRWMQPRGERNWRSEEVPGRIYQVEPTGAIEDDPNLTDTRCRTAPRRSGTPFPAHSISTTGNLWIEVLDPEARSRSSFSTNTPESRRAMLCEQKSPSLVEWPSRNREELTCPIPSTYLTGSK